MTVNCLYDPKSALPINERGRSPMQPVCANRLRVGHGRLIAGAKADDIEAVRTALDAIGPLLACQFRNDGLPCAHACERATDAVTAEFQELALRGGKNKHLNPPRWAGQ